MTSDPNLQSRIAAFLETLDALPPFAGLTLRGCAPDAEFVRDGQSVVTQGLVATSRNIKVATSNDTVTALYAILSRTGRSIASFSAQPIENEIVFLPGTVFYLAETRHLAGLDVRLVFEVDVHDPSFSLPEDLVPQVASNLERALVAHQESTSPPIESPAGKFVGDID